MPAKEYDWKNGVELEEHTRKKHNILKEYFRQYLITRCKIPHQERFRIAIVDGFAGGSQYICGSFGSPLIFIDTLIRTSKEINFYRTEQGLKPVFIDCLLILNDASLDAYEVLQKNVVPHLERAKQEAENLSIAAEIKNSKFEDIYPVIKKSSAIKTTNIFFNLDPCGYSQVTTTIIRDIMHIWKNAEILLTFPIQSLVTYLSPHKKASNVHLEPELQEKLDIIKKETINNDLLSKSEWLGITEQLVYSYLKSCATFVSPFTINNPSGWYYWLMHFANSYRARQVYNNVLHEDQDSQAHFGRAGFNMLSYDPNLSGSLYVFNTDSREAAKQDLYDDIPRAVSKFGDATSMLDFYNHVYSETPAHSDDIHQMMLENPDIEVLTEEGGGKRQKAHKIRPNDIIKLSVQRNFIFSH